MAVMTEGIAVAVMTEGTSVAMTKTDREAVVNRKVAEKLFGMRCSPIAL